MDKLSEMEERLHKYVGSRNEEEKAKFNEALEYVSTHLTPEVRERMRKSVNEGLERCRKEIIDYINSCEPEKQEMVIEEFIEMITEIKNKGKTE